MYNIINNITYHYKYYLTITFNIKWNTTDDTPLALKKEIYEQNEQKYCFCYLYWLTKVLTLLFLTFLCINPINSYLSTKKHVIINNTTSK